GFCQTLAQRLVLQIFHSNERLTLVLIDVVNGADVGMIERRGSFGFAPEALQSLAVSGQRQELEGDKAAELGVLGLVDHPHAASLQPIANSVVGNRLADHGFETRKLEACSHLASKAHPARTDPSRITNPQRQNRKSKIRRAMPPPPPSSQEYGLPIIG